MALKSSTKNLGVSYTALKSPEAFRSISEVSRILQVPQHVLRFWESKFVQLKPLKRRGGRRYYRISDIELLFGVHRLLYVDRYTIEGVQKVFTQQGVRFVADIGKRDLGASSGGVDTNENASIVSDSSTQESFGEVAQIASASILPPNQPIDIITNIGEDVRCKILRALDEIDEIAKTMQARE